LVRVTSSNEILQHKQEVERVEERYKLFPRKAQGWEGEIASACRFFL
jgi:hypothetical protein